ncbi:virulence factor MviN [Mariprofundus sp. NF]|uniref:murein biosynthesis integral membrane protein MurJ n=1 Tax=Mariprofundus sp. NF TaxID=2608716 RepID=UPI0015A129F3|nr:lipid II flippase MurJ [Mariprofundus sp. NF]NWF39502.1 virulence factor MviN [Mariprofundus sp. NF]
MRRCIKRLYVRWISWCGLSVNRSIFGAALSIAMITLVVRALSVGKDMAVASAFGIGDSLDIFLMACVLPAFAISVFAGSFYSSFIPVLISVREEHGHAAAKKLFSSVTLIALAVLGAVTVIFSVTNEWLIKMLAAGFSPSKLENTINVFDQMLPLILIGGMALFGGAVLNAQKKFSLVAVAPILTPVVIILLLYVFANGSGNPELLVMGTLSGAFFELCIIVWGLNRAGYVCLPIWHGLDNNSRKVITQYLPMIGGAFLMSGTVMVDQVMAAWLESGSVSALSFAIKVPALVTGLAAAGLGAAVLPYLSQQIAEADYRGLRDTLTKYSKLIVVISLPLTSIGLCFSEPLVELLFERGSFSREDTMLVSEVMRYSLLQVPFYILGILFARYVSVMSGNRFLLYVAILNLLLNVILNIILMRIIGVAGIALSTAAVYIVSTTSLYWIVKYQMKKLEDDGRKSLEI